MAGGGAATVLSDRDGVISVSGSVALRPGRPLTSTPRAEAPSPGEPAGESDSDSTRLGVHYCRLLLDFPVMSWLVSKD